MKFGFCLESVVQGHQEWRLPDVLQDLPLGPCVLCGFGLLHYCGLFQDFHGVQLASVVTADFTNQKYFSIS